MIDCNALIYAFVLWCGWAPSAYLFYPWSFGALGFDFDEVLMICTGLAAIAYVITDYKRDRDMHATMMTLHEDLGRIKTMVGWDLPHALSERVAKLEAVAPEGLAERIAGIEERVPDNAESRIAVLEDDAEFDRLVERVSALEKRTSKPPRARKKKEVST